MTNEHFRIVYGSPGYRVGREGEVQPRWSRAVYETLTETWLPLRPVRRGRYLTVNLSDEPARRAARYVHRLAWRHRLSVPPGGCVCSHRDGDPSDNRVQCLRWDTYQENSDDQSVPLGDLVIDVIAGQPSLSTAHVWSRELSG